MNHPADSDEPMSAPPREAARAVERAPAPRGASRRPSTARGEATRQRLLDAAERLFGERGYHDTSVVEITQEAGVGHGTFYLYFGTKEAIFGDLVRHLSRQLRRTLRAATAGLESRLAAEEAGARAFLQFAARHRNLYRIVFESQYVDPPLFRWYYERLAQGYAVGLQAAMEDGEIPRMHAETLAYCLMGASHFLGMRWVVWDGREPPAEAMDAMLAFVRQALTPAHALSAARPESTERAAGTP